jgi:site-specific DNA recombinase
LRGLPRAKDAATQVEGSVVEDRARNEGRIRSIVRAHPWAQSLQDGSHETVEMLAKANLLRPKVVRQALRLAFLSPDIAAAILEGRQPAGLTLARLPKLLPLAWAEHRFLAQLAN